MKKGFTLIELMVVVLIVGILAAVAIPLMQGRINSAKWSEGKAGAGTVMTALRAYAAEYGTNVKASPALVADLGFTATDLKGTYFAQSNYAVTGVAYDPTAGLDATITVTAPTGITPATKVLTIVDNVATWTEN
jgi:prepilin-type N-terminal cleavage/methylation domain-containing protein